MKSPRIQMRCKYFNWKLYQRRGIWQADGRSSNAVGSVQRYTLGSGNYDTALQTLHDLDLTLAVRQGLAAPSINGDDTTVTTGLEDGITRYLAYVERARVVGGATAKTAARYRAVFDKFMPFANGLKINMWNGVNTNVVSGYASWLEKNDYSYATQYLEVVTLKQIVKWLVAERLLPSGSEIRIKLKKPSETTTYCYTHEEVTAMLDHCRKDASLGWMLDVITILSRTGMRISELASARWDDIQGDFAYWVMPDESLKGTAEERRTGRTNKGRRTRRVPIHQNVRDVLVRLEHRRRPDGRIVRGPFGGVLKPDRVRIVLQRDVLTPLSGKVPSRPGGRSILDGRLHSFRHYFCSLCATSGVSERVLMSWLGHADSEMIRRYYHLQDDESRRRMDALRFSTD